MIRIITDSAADFEPWEMEKLNITCIPLVVMFGEEEYRENVNLTKTRFYELLEESDTLPKTAQASPQLLLELFEDAKKQGDDAIYICLSSALSGTCQSALMTKELVGSDRCYVVDSLNGTGGQRMIVEYAVELRDAGKTAPEIVAAIEALRNRVTLFACMDTLENLYRGGRISQSVYTLGTMVQIKPIIQVNTLGQVVMPAETMGLKKKGRLSVGADADLAVFDPAIIADRATFEAPDLPPVGVDRVILGGRTAVENGRIVNERLGEVLLRAVR